MAEYMDLSEPRSFKATAYIMLAWIIFNVIMLIGVGIRELKDYRAAEEAKIERATYEKIKNARK